MIIERPSAARGVVEAGWLDSRHTFSFGNYHDPAHMGFGALRVINEDRVQPGNGFGAHSHRDSAGGGDAGVLKPGELQWMSAGHGIEHSEFNASKTEPVHFLQIWIQPDRVNAAPAYAQQAFDPAQRRGRWATLASPDGSDGSIAIRQQAWLRGALLAAGDAIEVAFDPARRYWLHVAQGAVEFDGRRLSAGDAIGAVDEAGRHRLLGVGDGAADVLLFDLPG